MNAQRHEWMDRAALKSCQHEGEESWWEYDARGIELCKVCRKCKAVKLAGYRREVLTDSQYEADEAIEPEDY